MSKKIVILSGSPRKNGTTDKLVAAFQEGIESVGNNATVYRVADLRISGCVGCSFCYTAEGQCSIKDDMTDILVALKEADAIVFASPVYFACVSGQLKIAIDRIHAVTNHTTNIKRSALLLTCGETANHSAQGAILMYTITQEYLKWENVGIVLVTGLESRDDIDGREELEQARKLGTEI